ncbi:MAG: globin [Rhizobiales bacterium]|nr:globin [Hyphomicrobiales bacterium]
MNGDLILRSLDLVAERCEDPTPLVYERLFARHPEMEPLFVMDKSGAARGHMLSEAIESLIDFVGPRSYAVTLLQSEHINHNNLGVPSDIFTTFFDNMKESFRAILGDEWTDETDAAWCEALLAIDEVMKSTSLPH